MSYLTQLTLLVIKNVTKYVLNICTIKAR